MKNDATIFRIDKDGFAYGLTECHELFVGSIHDHAGRFHQYWKDTPENREKAERIWIASSYAKEIKRADK